LIRAQAGRLYPNDCRELLQRQYGPNMKLNAEHLLTASPPADASAPVAQPAAVVPEPMMISLPR
jgi:hypothetical protein